MLKELLDHVVPEHVGHQLQRVLTDLLEHNFLLVAIGRLELLLDEAGSMLVTAKFHNVLINVLFVVRHCIQKERKEIPSLPSARSACSTSNWT